MYVSDRDKELLNVVLFQVTDVACTSDVWSSSCHHVSQGQLKEVGSAMKRLWSTRERYGFLFQKLLLLCKANERDGTFAVKTGIEVYHLLVRLDAEPSVCCQGFVYITVMANFYLC